MDATKASVEMRTTRDGRVALLAYSALDRLHDCCGKAQPWIVMPTASLDSLQAAQPFQLLLLDMAIPEERRTAVGS
ncbi:SAV_915 family protein [Amycolatopsis magusensis]|uniref:SAV_915 family protein n=1 Tax=Amycolatopsis magusensis TaxID=882444 RepID=UPI003C2C7CE7